jgi:glucose-6-phosphate 1-dehydrogenase
MSAVVEASPAERPEVPRLPTGDSCVLVIFGASGDLAHRKLIPALYDLACAGCMNARFEILGIGRKDIPDEKFRDEMYQAASRSHDAREFNDQCWGGFARSLHYLRGDASQASFYGALSDRLQQMEKAGASPNRLFYLSVPPSVAPEIVRFLGDSGLARNKRGWTRVIVEKPFGRDLDSARELNRELLEVFEEEQIYRIDHYLGKETVQNIVVFRFGNSLWEPVWNRNYVDYVEITATETLGVENRAAFYEQTGALRDMVANHLLQLLTLTAMEPPVAFDADSVRGEKVQVLRAIHPMSIEEVARRTVRGQYGPGVVAGKTVPGYRQEPGVDPKSTTETFVALKLFIDNWRWAGVPFYVRTGKRMSAQVTEVRVHFKRTPQALFAREPQDRIEPNIIDMRIQPNEGISISFGAKRPGTQMKMIGVHADFSYAKAFGADTPVAYETLLLDAMRGDPTLFTRRDEVEAEWQLITPILNAWTELPPPNFPNYDAGSNGPREAEDLISRQDHGWLDLAARR